MTVNWSETMRNADGLLEDFKEKLRDVPYEAKGVLFSEMFFLYAAIGRHQPSQVLESGRARAQSTYALGVLFPDSRIISIERYDDSEDVAVAEQRLANLPAVSPLYGDSEVVLPALVRESDVILIDGPKHFAAIRLALRMLATGKPHVVFVHDCYQGLPERSFVEKHLPEAFFSDDLQFIERYRALDDVSWSTINDQDIQGWRPYQYDGEAQKSYGPTFACIPLTAGKDYQRLILMLRIAKLRANFFGA